MKRALDDSDCEDFIDEGSNTGSPSQSCQVQDRKRRRGVIEKRRRDRINSSLSELKRLVPSAFEKQGSAKLEKAEILQMTVDHLKMLNARGLNNPATFEGDYRNMGFRECCTEVARYLATAEGLDLQNPLRIRLLSHLEAYGAQKELQLKAELSGYNWHHRLSGYSATSQNALYPSHQDSSHISSKLKDPSTYGSTYHSTAGYYGQTATIQGQNTPSSFNSTPGLTNLSPNALYGSGNYNSADFYKSFRPW